MPKKKDDDDMEDTIAEDRALLFKALNAAVTAFNRTLEAEDVDGAYFAIKVQGWELSMGDFQPLNRGITMDMREPPRKERKDEHR